jgi:DNA (cytosine-5)-methyltransferase 1
LKSSRSNWPDVARRSPRHIRRRPEAGRDPSQLRHPKLPLDQGDPGRHPDEGNVGTVNELSLFTGAGGGLLGSALLGWRPICAVEKEPYCREVLLRRQRDGLLPLFPVWDDVKTFDGSRWRGKVDIITAGFPCQPFSVAGRRDGAADERNLWPETIRVIREVEPRCCLLENVPGLLAHRYFGTILGQLAESGYRVRWDCIPASAVGAPHQRDRLWIVAYAERDSIWDEPERREGPAQETLKGDTLAGHHGPKEPVAHSHCGRLKECGGQMSARLQGAPGDHSLRGSGTWWAEDPADVANPEGCSVGGGFPMCRNAERQGGYALCSDLQDEERQAGPTESRLGRVAHGMAHRVDRLRAVGNGQVPAVVAAAWLLLTES